MTIYNVTVSESLFTHESPFGASGLTLQSGVGISLTANAAFFKGVALVDALRLHEASSPVMRYKRTLNVPLMVQSLLYPGTKVSLTSGVGIHDLTKVVQAVVVINQLRLHDAPGALARYAQAMLDSIKFQSALARFLSGALPVNSIGFHDAFTPVYQATARVNEQMALASLLGGSLLFRLDVDDEVDFDDNNLLKMIYKGDHLLDSFRIWASYVDPGGGFTTWAINTRTSAVTEYENYAFNSMCRFGHRFLGADSTGLWALDGELDDTMEVPTRIRSGWMQFGGSHFTSFKAAYLGLRINDASRDFILKLHAGDGREYVYAVKPQNMQTTKVHMGKGLRSRYFSFELITDGADYDLDSVEFIPISTQRRV